MNCLETILTRRSIRRFTNEPIDEAILQQIVTAGLIGPSAQCQRMIECIVTTKRDLIDRIPTFHVYAKMCLEAQAIIAVVADLRRQKTDGYAAQDGAIATQNMHLAAHALGLGSVWLGIHPRPEREAGVRALFGIPAEVLPISLLVLGHPGEKKAPNRIDVKTLIHRDQWESR